MNQRIERYVQKSAASTKVLSRMAKAYEHTQPELAQQLHGALNAPLHEVKADRLQLRGITPGSKEYAQSLASDRKQNIRRVFQQPSAENIHNQKGFGGKHSDKYGDFIQNRYSGRGEELAKEIPPLNHTNPFSGVMQHAGDRVMDSRVRGLPATNRKNIRTNLYGIE